jgi:hypothetical protein
MHYSGCYNSFLFVTFILWERFWIFLGLLFCPVTYFHRLRLYTEELCCRCVAAKTKVWKEFVWEINGKLDLKSFSTLPLHLLCCYTLERKNMPNWILVVNVDVAILKKSIYKLWRSGCAFAILFITVLHCF